MPSTGPALVPRVLGRLAPRVLWHGPAGANAVALTFDDGPHRTLTPRLLDLLATHGARATFFVIGERIAGHEDVLERIVAEGHELGNHLMRDELSARLPLGEFARQLAEVTAMIARYQEVRWFRPGSGWFTPRMLDVAADQGLRCVLGSVAGMHSGRLGDRFVGGRVLQGLTPGAIGVLHEGSDRRHGVLAATDGLARALHRRGRRLVTVSELVGDLVAGPAAPAAGIP